jgi:hypothetical protein
MGQLKFCKVVIFMYEEIEFEHLEVSGPSRFWMAGTCTGLIWLGIETLWRACVNAVMNLRDPLNAVNVLTGSGNVSLSKRTLLRGVI